MKTAIIYFVLNNEINYIFILKFRRDGGGGACVELSAILLMEEMASTYHSKDTKVQNLTTTVSTADERLKLASQPLLMAARFPLSC